MNFITQYWFYIFFWLIFLSLLLFMYSKINNKKSNKNIWLSNEYIEKIKDHDNKINFIVKYLKRIEEKEKIKQIVKNEIN